MTIASIHDYVAYIRKQGAPHYDGGLLELTSPTDAIGAGVSGGAGAAVAIGFDFVLFGVTYTSVTVGPYGWAKLSGSSPGGNNTRLFDAADPALLAPWWDELITADTTGAVRYELQGSAPRRALVIEWEVYAVVTQTATDHDLLTFQAVLHESGLVEYRYGPHVVTGTPTGTPSASVGAKDDTTSDTTAYRDLAAVEADCDLGGSETTTTATLGLASYPGAAAEPYNIRFEPNVPIPDYYDPIEATAFVGRNRPDAQPLDRIGRNHNFVVAHHSPPLVNVGFFCDEAEDRTFVIPVRPSPDNRAYKVLPATYSYSGDNGSGIDLSIYEDRKGASSQVGTSAHWALAHTENRLPHGADSSEWWDEYEVTLDHRTRLLKVYVQNVDLTPHWVLPLSLLIYPAPLTALAEEAPSGVQPYAVAQLLQEDGGAIHKEIANRMWASIARALGALEQMVFAFVQSVTTKVTWTHSAAQPVHTIGSWGPSLPGQAGAVLAVRVYAKSTADGSKIVVGEEAGNQVEITIDGNGGEYRLVTGQLTLTRSKPTLYAHCAPATGATVTALAIVGAWRPGA